MDGILDLLFSRSPSGCKAGDAAGRACFLPATLSNVRVTDQFCWIYSDLLFIRFRHFFHLVFACFYNRLEGGGGNSKYLQTRWNKKQRGRTKLSTLITIIYGNYDDVYELLINLVFVFFSRSHLLELGRSMLFQRSHKSQEDC